MKYHCFLTYNRFKFKKTQKGGAICTNNARHDSNFFEGAAEFFLAEGAVTLKRLPYTDVTYSMASCHRYSFLELSSSVEILFFLNQS